MNLAKRSDAAEPRQAAAASGSGKPNPFGAAAPRDESAYQAKREAEKPAAKPAEKEVQQERKPRSNPFGDATPTEIKEIEVKTSAASDKKAGAQGEGEDAKPAEKPAEKKPEGRDWGAARNSDNKSSQAPKKVAPKAEAPKAKAAAPPAQKTKAKTKAPANAFDLLQGESGSDEEDEE